MNQILDAQAAGQLRVKSYERTEERQGYRNGYWDKVLKFRVGELGLMVSPARRLRSGNFSTELFARYQRIEQVLFKVNTIVKIEKF